VVLVGGGEVRPVERQQTGAAGGRSQAALHIGVDDIPLFPVASVEALQQNGADLPGALQGGVLGRVQKALLDGDMVLGKVVAAVFAHHEQLAAGVAGQHLHGLLDGVLVVGAGQALVRRDDQAGIGPALDVVLVGRVEVRAVGGAGS